MTNQTGNEWLTCCNGYEHATNCSKGEQGAPEQGLLPCPFCGAEMSEGLAHSVHNKGCYIISLTRDVTAWNTRADQSVAGVWDLCIAEIPDSWLDNLLTGPNATLQGKGGTWRCPDIERLLQGVKGRMLEAKARSIAATVQSSREQCRGNETGFHTCGLPIGGCGKSVSSCSQPESGATVSEDRYSLACPHCGGNKTWITDSRLNMDADERRRRYKCDGCNKRFTAYERVRISHFASEQSKRIRQDLKSIVQLCEKVDDLVTETSLRGESGART